MALHPTTLGQATTVQQDLARVLLIIAAVVVVMLVLTALFGVHLAAPSLQIVPDPAGVLGLPF